jgi:hypothetical protein
VEVDEQRLADLGRKAIEMFAIAYIFNERIHVGACACLVARPRLASLLPARSRAGSLYRWTGVCWATSTPPLALHPNPTQPNPTQPNPTNTQASYQEAESLKRQDQLIAEEEEEERSESQRQLQKSLADREKRLKKKVRAV